MQSIAGAFKIEGRPIYCERYGNGHINRTYLLRTDAPHDYILQRVNRTIFKDVPALMGNIAAVTAHLRSKGLSPREVLTLIPTKAGGTYAVDDEGEYWRVYDFITDSLCLERAESADDFRQSALAFGRFQNLLADFPAETLNETIPRFHDTTARYAALHDAAQADVMHRSAKVARELDFAFERESEAASLMKLMGDGLLPKKVTHNDTKLNNVMLDATTRKPLCVIDLDTVMPGLVANDFGDSIRFGASTAAEDEMDLDKVSMSLALFETYARGFLEECKDRLTPLEVETLPLGAKLMTLECGVRFLTDYLNGDTYFAIHRPEHNYDRCRTQLKLVADMERKWNDMCAVIERSK